MSEAHALGLPQGWAATTLGAIQLDLGGSLDPARTPDAMFELYSVPSHEKGVPEIVKGSDVGSNKQTVESGTVLLCKINPRINRVWVTGNHSHHTKIASTEWIPFFPLSGIEPRYLAYFLRQGVVRDFLARNASGVGGSLMRIRAATFRDFTFQLAPFREQSRIGDALDELFSDRDAGVAALERAREKLTLYRASVLKAAVEGTLTAEWRAQHPHTEPAPQLLERILCERRRRWEEEQLAKFKAKEQEPPKNWKAKYKEPTAPDTANLPLLPAGWCWATWPQTGTSQNGRPFPSKDYCDTGTKLLRPGNLHSNGSIEWTERNTKRMPNSFAEKAPDLIVRRGELVMNLTAQSLKDDFLGRVCLTASGDPCLLNQRLARLTPTIVESKFMLWVFKSAHFRKFVAGLNTGSLIQHMFTSQLDRFLFPLPPLEEQEAIVEAVEDQLSVIDHLEADLDAKLTNAQGLRQSILRHAFTGRLVPQDPNDEPASDLLQRIAAERAARGRAAAAAKQPRATPRRSQRRRPNARQGAGTGAGP